MIRRPRADDNDGPTPAAARIVGPIRQLERFFTCTLLIGVIVIGGGLVAGFNVSGPNRWGIVSAAAGVGALLIITGIGGRRQARRTSRHIAQSWSKREGGGDGFV